MCVCVCARARVCVFVGGGGGKGTVLSGARTGNVSIHSAVT